MTRPVLDTFVFNCHQVSKDDRAKIDTFVAQQNGLFSPTWTFQLLPTAFPQNNSFNDGLTGWTTQPDPAWSVQWKPTGSFDNGAYAFLTTGFPQYVIQPATTQFGRILCTPVACATQEIVNLSYWVMLAASGLPLGATIASFALVTIFDAHMNVLSQINPGINVVGPAAWQQVSATFTIQPAAAAFFQLILIVALANQSAGGFNAVSTTAQAGFDTVFVTQQGQPGVYPMCVFEDEAFTWTENADAYGRFSGTIRFRQSGSGGQIANPHYNGGFLGPGPGGAVTCLPFVSRDEYYVARNDLDCGAQYRYGFYGAGLPSFPSRKMKRWTLNMAVLTDAQLAVLESAFVGSNGSYMGFAFTDPYDNKTYWTTRFASDTLNVNHVAPGQNKCDVELVEYYNTTQWQA